MKSFSEYINGIAKLGLSVAASALSSTILKHELIPFQIEWLGTAGTVVAACMIPITFANQHWFGRTLVRWTLTFAIAISLAIVIWLRASCVVRVDYGNLSINYLVGANLTSEGEEAKTKSTSVDDAHLIAHSGPEHIAEYWSGYKFMYYMYVSDYLMLLVFFVGLVAPIDLRRNPAPV